MNPQTLLVTEGEFKQICAFSYQIDPSWGITHCIVNAQNKQIKKLLGAALFNELVTQFNANTLTPANSTLLEKLKYVIAYRAAEKAVLLNSVRIANIGNVQNRGANEAPYNVVINNLINYYASEGTQYAATLVCFLKENKATYPLWIDNTQKNADSVANDGGIYQSPRARRRTQHLL